MDCAKVEELTSEYVEGTLPAPLERTVRAHLDACPDCAEDVAEMRSLCARLAALPAAAPPPFFHENVMAAVAREATARRMPWQTLPPRMGRVALGTFATGGLAAALAWTLLAPTAPSRPRTGAGLDVLSRIVGPSGDDSTATRIAPRLRMTRTTVLDPDHGPAYQYDVRLEGAERGAARFHLLPDDALATKTAPVDRFIFGDASTTERLRVPFKSVRGATLNLYVRWTANEQTHRTYRFEPIPRNDDLPPERQSFGLPESSLLAAARAVAERYGRAITLEDVPDVDVVTVVAGENTAAEALAKALSGRGLRVSETKTGILITPDRSAAR